MMAYPWSDKTVAIVNKNEQSVDYQNRKAASHAFLYCNSSALLFETIDMKHGIMMQLRFDGTLGFPGGLIDENENPVDGLNRELLEEIGLSEKFYLDESNYFSSWIYPKLVDHFYVKKFSEMDFIEIERTALRAVDWGSETLGIMRVPVHDLANHAKTPPFASFLGHNFISNAQEQLIEGILREKILTFSKMSSLWDLYMKNQALEQQCETKTA